jgi:Fic family protein
MGNAQRAGRFTPQAGFSAFVLAGLPPNPSISWDSELHDLLEVANRALGRLDGATLIAPNPDLFLYTYIRKEAVLSSQIEGTQSSLSDLLLFENADGPGIPIDDLREVSNYVAAMEHGLHRLRGGFPLSLRLIREIHAIVVRGSRGADKTPGEFRRSQNWIGGTKPGDAFYVPPPVHELMPALDNLREPLLYLSLYLKQNRPAYYDALQRIRVEGDWEQWLKFFLRGVAQVAQQGVETMRRLLDLFARDRDRIQTHLPGRRGLSALRVHDVLKQRTVTSITLAATATGLTAPTVASALDELQQLGIVREMTERQRNRRFLYVEYFKTLDEGAASDLPETPRRLLNSLE